MSDDLGGRMTSGLAYRKEIKYLRYFNERRNNKIKINEMNSKQKSGI